MSTGLEEPLVTLKITHREDIHLQIRSWTGLLKCEVAIRPDLNKRESASRKFQVFEHWLRPRFADPVKRLIECID